ncbi:sulfur carrier protein ThiS [Helicobacter apodemus]|uniref:Sulfur carrier protein ThiS n=1 Tax=Helicobacter apodemus TaxID=135569 RepID=A0A099U660_9HELI|nr:sulfur carrier protein ThiS [Helicobacter apodemus]AWI33656.1 thiamine biosynthesis protein ThiS [Helicobacter apodemus]MDE6958894.1 sulfur carrier protein ThiS [Helicobacter apodemus]TLE14526.1 sulfur carrier protein ThiS [Helicobacter apodemus]
MQVRLNGKNISTQTTTLLHLLQEYKIDTKSIAVAINLEVIKRDKWDTHSLKEGDTIECLTFLGGG